MLTVSVSKFRANLFDYLDLVSGGEIVVIERNNKVVARLVASQQTDWRVNMIVRSEILVEPGELVKPLDGVWDEYL